jgi:hypothetical protein
VALSVFSLEFFIFLVSLNRDQELKEYSRRKSLFIRNKSGVWAALSQQRALVEEA